MNDLDKGKIIIQDIDNVIKNINDTWIDIKNKDIKKLNEAWESPSCVEYIRKYKNAEAKIKSITNKLYFIKACWENYINNHSINNVPKGENKNE